MPPVRSLRPYRSQTPCSRVSASPRRPSCTAFGSVASKPESSAPHRTTFDGRSFPAPSPPAPTLPACSGSPATATRPRPAPRGCATRSRRPRACPLLRRGALIAPGQTGSAGARPAPAKWKRCHRRVAVAAARRTKGHLARLAAVRAKRQRCPLGRHRRLKPRKMTLSFSNREKMRRNPFSRRNSRSTSLRRFDPQAVAPHDMIVGCYALTVSCGCLRAPMGAWAFGRRGTWPVGFPGK